MTDRELLEAAARAAGIDATWSEWSTGRVAEFGCIKYQKHEGLRFNGKTWNPLTDDGDAFRLAAGLGLVVDFSRPSAALPFTRHEYSLSEGGNNPEATRRAIVRAAAQIGGKR